MSYAVAFDLDGTLVDLPVDIELVRNELNAMFAPLGYSGEFRPILLAIEEAAQVAAGGDADRRRELRNRARGVLDTAEVEAAGNTALADDALEVVGALAALDVALGLVTNNGRACAEACLSRLPQRFASVVSRDDVRRWKPAPDGVLVAARALLPYGGQLWFVGDSETDVAAARAADAQLTGVDVFAVMIGDEDADADIVIQELSELVGKLEELH